jgi:hypothetical protein
MRSRGKAAGDSPEAPLIRTHCPLSFRARFRRDFRASRTAFGRESPGFDQVRHPEKLGRVTSPEHRRFLAQVRHARKQRSLTSFRISSGNGWVYTTFAIELRMFGQADAELSQQGFLLRRRLGDSAQPDFAAVGGSAKRCRRSEVSKAGRPHGVTGWALSTRVSDGAGIIAGRRFSRCFSVTHNA